MPLIVGKIIRVNLTLHPGEASGNYYTLHAGIITYFVPCYTAGKNAEAIGEGCLVHGVYSVIPILGIYCHALIRGKIREQKNIEVHVPPALFLSLSLPPSLPPSPSN